MWRAQGKNNITQNLSVMLYKFESCSDYKCWLKNKAFVSTGKVTKKRKLESLRGTITSIALATFNYSQVAEW